MTIEERKSLIALRDQLYNELLIQERELPWLVKLAPTHHRRLQMQGKALAQIARIERALGMR